jgi:AraC-like DNA-binding protein
MSISVVFVRSLVDELKRRGFDPVPLLALAEIELASLGDIRSAIEPAQSELLIDGVIERTGDESIGLAIGANASGNSLQLFGHLLLAQPTIRAAFEVAQRYSALMATGPSWRLIEHDDVAIWGIVTALPPGRLARVFMDYAVAVTRRLGGPLFPPGERLRAVWFQHEAPAYRARYAEIFPTCPVLFGQEVNGTVFARSFLDRQQSHADNTVATLLRESAEQLLREREHMTRLSAQVASFLRYRADLASVSLEQTARQLGIGARVLRRRLTEEGASFRGLVDDARRRVACEALLQSESSILHTAESLGFSEPSAFFRAFKRWTGLTPSQYRRTSMGETVPDAAVEPAHGES